MAEQLNHEQNGGSRSSVIITGATWHNTSNEIPGMASKFSMRENLEQAGVQTTADAVANTTQVIGVPRGTTEPSPLVLQAGSREHALLSGSHGGSRMGLTRFR